MNIGGRRVRVFNSPMPEDENLTPALVLLTAFAIGIGVRDQRLLDVLAVIMEERQKAAEES
jgi:hypothetical protein